MANADQIGLALQGFSAGVGGQLPQFQQGLATRAATRQKLDVTRKKAMAQDLLGANNLLKSGDLQGAVQLLQNRSGLVTQLGGDNSDTNELLGEISNIQTPEDLASITAQLDLLVNRSFESGLLDRPGVGNEQAFFEDVTKDFTPEEQVAARKVKAGLQARAVGSAAQTIAKEGTAEEVGESEAVIAQRKKFGELTGSSRAKSIDKGFDNIVKINKNIRNMGRAITAIDEGASTGAIESRFFPSFRKSTLQLEALQKELALDVIGSVTFGALSQGELDLAQLVALPTNLEPADLKQHLVDKIAAQEKLRGYYQEQIDFLDQGGTIAGFLRQQDRGSAADTQTQGGSATVDLTKLSNEELLQLKQQQGG